MPWANASPQPTRHLDRFSRVCTDDRRVFLYFTMVRRFPIQNCPFSWMVASRHRWTQTVTLQSFWAKINTRICTNYRDLQIRHRVRLTVWSRSGDDGLSLFEPCITVSSCDAPLSVADGAIAYTTTKKNHAVTDSVAFRWTQTVTYKRYHKVYNL